MKAMGSILSIAGLQNCRIAERIVPKFHRWLFTFCNPAILQSCNPLKGSTDPAVLADAPEVHRHEDGNGERQSHTVQHVETQQRALTDERSTQQGKPCIVSGMDQLHVTQGQQRRPRTFMA
jgi:hypothetical protein